MRQQNIVWRKAWATLVNKHLKRYRHKIEIDERSLRAQGIQRRPINHKQRRSKASRAMLDGLRARQPVLPLSPIMRLSKITGDDGNVTLQAVVTGSALNKIGPEKKELNQSFAPAIHQTRKGWPPEAIAAWEAWGSKNPPLFFRIWSELAPDGFTLGGGPRL